MKYELPKLKCDLPSDNRLIVDPSEGANFILIEAHNIQNDCSQSPLFIINIIASPEPRVRIVQTNMEVTNQDVTPWLPP